MIRSQGELAEDSKFKDYADFAEPLSKIASHRAMALFRGRDAGELSLAIQLETRGDFAGGFRPPNRCA